MDGNGCTEDCYAPENVRRYAMELPDQLEWALNYHLDDMECRGRVCIFGVGNSAMAGDVMQQYLDEVSDVNVPMVSGDMVPGWLGADDHAILISYSGCSPEILACYTELMRRGCHIHCIVGGGSLADLCYEDRQHFIMLPKDIPSRFAIGYEIGYLARIIQALGVNDVADLLITSLDELRRDVSRMSDVQSIERIAQKMRGKVPAIYATSDMLSVAKRWRLDLYQTCNMVSFYSEMPEFDHNEIVGWADPNSHAPNLAMFAIRGPDEPQIVKIIVDSMTEVLDEFDREVNTINIAVNNPLHRNICGCVLGDLVSARLKELMS